MESNKNPSELYCTTHQHNQVWAYTRGCSKDAKAGAGIWEGPHQGAPICFPVRARQTPNQAQAQAQAQAMAQAPPCPWVDGQYFGHQPCTD